MTQQLGEAERELPPTDDTDKAFLREAIQLAIESVDDGGAPFGAVVVHNGEVIARAGNRAKLDCAPTAHAQVAAILPSSFRVRFIR